MGRRLFRCHLLAAQWHAGCAEHQAKCDPEPDANGDPQGYAVHDRTQCGAETQTQTNADTDVFHKLARANSATTSSTDQTRSVTRASPAISAGAASPVSSALRCSRAKHLDRRAGADSAGAPTDPRAWRFAWQHCRFGSLR